MRPTSQTAGKFLILFALAAHGAHPAGAQVRLKDLGRVAGAEGVSLIGYSLVVGLDRTGDSPRSLFTNQSLVNMLERFGVAVDGERVRAQNVAAVMVTAEVPAFARAGSRFDVTVSSLGDAKSLQGGVLLQAPLADLSGEVWGTASGPVSIGGFNIETPTLTMRQNHPTVGRVPQGLTLSRDVAAGIRDWSKLRFILREADFTTARNLAEAVNQRFGAQVAQATDAGSVEIAVPDSFRQARAEVAFVAELEAVPVQPDVAARVVINERTGTIIIGERVSLATVAISHGSLAITIKGAPVISQPPPFSPGATVVTQIQEVKVEQPGTGVVTIPGAATVGDVAAALNRLGVTPREMVAIFQALKSSGALQAELIII